MIDYVALDNALHGRISRDDLDAHTRAQYDAIGPVKTVEPSRDDVAVKAYWDEVNAAEEAIGPTYDRLGEGPEFDRFLADVNSFNEPAVEAVPKRRSRRPR